MKKLTFTIKGWALGMSLLMLFSVHAEARLQRTAFLGVAPTPGESGEPVQVSSVHPQGTGAGIGLKVGDTLKTLNGNPISDFADLVAQLSDTPEGTRLTLTVVRADKLIELSGLAKSRPLEQGSGYLTEYGEFDWQGNQIRTITYYPDSPRLDGAAVMFIQGYTCGSIDYGMAPDITITQLLATYAKAGFTVLKMEKPGVGDSQGTLNCIDIDFDTENAAFVAGLKHLKSFENVNEDNLFVFGHSLGVLHAAMIAEKGLAKGVMGYGGVLKSWYAYLQDIYTVQATKYFGVSNDQAASNLSTVKPFLKAWLNTDKEWRQVLRMDAVKRALQTDLLPVNGERVFDRHYSFFRSLNRHDFRELWANSQSHALMLHGTYDIQAIEGSWAGQIADLINESGNVSAKAMQFERTEHALLRYPTLDALQTAMQEGTNNAGNPGDKYNPDIAKASLAWMQRILSGGKG